MAEGRTLVRYRGKGLGYHCGYCGSDFGKVSCGMPTRVMSPFHYQALIDRGWRRSGTYCYKPVMNETCCPQYTIRCKALEYKLTKSRKKVLNKMRRFLLSEDYSCVKKWKAKFETSRDSRNSDSELPAVVECQDIVEGSPGGDNTEASPSSVKIRKSGFRALEVVSEENAKRLDSSHLERNPSKKPKLSGSQKIDQTQEHVLLPGGVESSEKRIKSEVSFQQAISLRDRISHLNHDAKFHKRLTIRTVRAHTGDRDFESTRKESFLVYQKYQQVIHGDSPSHCTESQWENFLVSCSILPDSNGPGPGYGNYHQQYVLDGKIIAVGVIDILPQCLSSVYLYYDPDFGFLSLGIYSALSEIAYVQKLNELAPNLQYYYMGFYIHSCTKMKYKGEHSPSELLCPVSYTWHPIEQCVPALDKAKYVEFSALKPCSSIAESAEKLSDFDISTVGIYYRKRFMNYGRYKALKYCDIDSSNDEECANHQASHIQFTKQRIDQELSQLSEYVSLVGTDLAMKMHLLK